MTLSPEARCYLNLIAAIILPFIEFAELIWQWLEGPQLDMPMPALHPCWTATCAGLRTLLAEHGMAASSKARKADLIVLVLRAAQQTEQLQRGCLRA